MKKKIFYLFVDITDKLCYSLRLVCCNMPPQARIIIVVTLFILFGVLNMYITSQGIYSIFKEDSKEDFLEIKHIEQLEFLRNDSIVNQLRIEN